MTFSAEAITAWSTLGLAALTAVLALYTAMLYRETRRVRLERLEPNVIVTIEQSRMVFSYFDLVIENLGPGSAHSVKIVPPADFKITGATWKVDHSPLFSIKFMKPGASVRTLLGKLSQISPHELTFAITYINAKGAERSSDHTIHIGHFQGMLSTGELYPAQSISDSLKKIEDHLGRLGRGWSRIKVDTYDSEDRQKEAIEQEAWLEQQTAPQKKQQGGDPAAS